MNKRTHSEKERRMKVLRLSTDETFSYRSLWNVKNYEEVCRGGFAII